MAEVRHAEKAIDYFVARGWLNRWRGADNWIGRIVEKSDDRRFPLYFKKLQDFKEFYFTPWTRLAEQAEEAFKTAFAGMVKAFGEVETKNEKRKDGVSAWPQSQGGCCEPWRT